MRHTIGEKLPFECVHQRRFAFIKQKSKITLRSEDEELVGVDQRAPEIAVGIEGDAIGPGAFTEARGAEDLALHGFAALVDAQPRDAAAGGFDDIEPLFAGVEADFVGEAEAVGDDAEAAIFVARKIAIGEVRAEGVHPVPDARGDGDPDATLAITEGCTTNL